MGRAVLRLAVLLLAGALTLPPVATAQTAQSPAAVLTLDPERLFEETAFGRRVQREIETRAQALATENRRIERELIAEERELTELRPTLAIDEFRTLADAFDEKVDRIREQQDAKTRDLQQLREIERQRFFGQIGQVLSAILQERNAAVVLDRRNVFIAVDAVDITAEAIRRIDAEIGDGAEEAPEEAAEEAQDDATD